MAQYYYTDSQGQPAGPVPLAQLHILKSQGVITDTTWVIRNGDSQWVAYASLKAKTITANSTAAVRPSNSDINIHAQTHNKSTILEKVSKVFQKPRARIAAASCVAVIVLLGAYYWKVGTLAYKRSAFTQSMVIDFCALSFMKDMARWEALLSENRQHYNDTRDDEFKTKYQRAYVMSIESLNSANKEAGESVCKKVLQQLRDMGVTPPGCWSIRKALHEQCESLVAVATQDPLTDQNRSSWFEKRRRQLQLVVDKGAAVRKVIGELPKVKQQEGIEGMEEQLAKKRIEDRLNELAK